VGDSGLASSRTATVGTNAQSRPPVAASSVKTSARKPAAPNRRKVEPKAPSFTAETAVAGASGSNSSSTDWETF
jgi:hypothetical protein